MAKIKVILEVDLDQLKQTRIEAIGKREAKKESLSESISQELGWVNASGISVDSVEEVSEDKEILNLLNGAISNDEDGDDVAIIEFLRGADEDTLDEFAHGHEFEHNGKTIEISMWEPLDHFTLRQLSDHVGL